MDDSILLIFPPFSAMRLPYASLPVLAGYLRSRNIKVKSLDANNEFFHRFLTPARLAQAVETVESRLLELNGRQKLSYSEESEYLALVQSLHYNRKRHEDFPRIFDGLKGNRRLNAFYGAMNLASLPYYPQMLSIDPRSLNLRYYTPLSPYSTQSILKSLESDSLLAGYFEDLLYPLLERETPRIIGLSVSFSLQIEGALWCARVIKKRYPQVHIVLGGAYISCIWRRMDNPKVFDYVDSLVMGDGEVPLERLFHELGTPQPQLERVPGLVYREAGKIKRNASATPLPMETLPPPDYNTLDLDRYLVPRQEQYLPLRTSRGCYWRRCAFCRTDLEVVSHNQHPSADYLYETIRDVIKDTGAKRLTFSDEAATPKILDELSHRFIRDKLSLTWATNVRFSPELTSERFALYKQAGASNINMGLETYNDRLLNLAGKGIKTEWINQVLANMAWNGLGILVYMIVGFPTETEAEAVRSFLTVAQFRNMGLLSSFRYNMLQILPYSAMYNDPDRFGINRLIIPEEYDLDGPIFEFEASCGMSRNQAHRFSLLFNGESPPSVSEVPIAGCQVKLNFDVAQLHENRLARKYISELPAKRVVGLQ